MFFGVLKEARKVYQTEKAVLMHDLCDVAAVAWGGKNHEIMKKHFADRANPSRKKRRALDAGSPATAQIVATAFRSIAPFIRGGLN